jgi:hypothetical protein
MSQNPLAPVIAYHDQLKRLSAAGVALDLGLEKNDAPSKHRDVLKAIQRAEVALQLRVGLGQPLVDAVFAARELTPKYRASLLSWIETADIPTAFDPLTKSARDFVRVRRQLGDQFHPSADHPDSRLARIHRALFDDGAAIGRDLSTDVEATDGVTPLACHHAALDAGLDCPLFRSCCLSLSLISIGNRAEAMAFGSRARSVISKPYTSRNSRISWLHGT